MLRLLFCLFSLSRLTLFFFFFFFNDTATTEIYTLSLHDALPICRCPIASRSCSVPRGPGWRRRRWQRRDRKSTRLNSSHVRISYAVFCLKKKKPTWNALLWSYNKQQQDTN